MMDYGEWCYICGVKLTPFGSLKSNFFTLDHVHAKSKGGTELMAACNECNGRKADMDLIRLKKGSVIKSNGIPYVLALDALVYGNHHNQTTSPDAGTPTAKTNNKAARG